MKCSDNIGAFLKEHRTWWLFAGGILLVLVILATLITSINLLTSGNTEAAGYVSGIPLCLTGLGGWVYSNSDNPVFPTFVAGMFIFVVSIVCLIIMPSDPGFGIALVILYGITSVVTMCGIGKALSIAAAENEELSIHVAAAGNEELSIAAAENDELSIAAAENEKATAERDSNLLSIVETATKGTNYSTMPLKSGEKADSENVVDVRKPAKQEASPRTGRGTGGRNGRPSYTNSHRLKENYDATSTVAMKLSAWEEKVAGLKLAEKKTRSGVNHP